MNQQNCWLLFIRLNLLLASGFWPLVPCLWIDYLPACDEPIGREPFGSELTAEGLRAEWLSRVETSSQ
jgi:hypothetical protein